MTLLERVALKLYGLLMHALQPWVRRKLRRRAVQEPRYLHEVAQRFGDYPADSTPDTVPAQRPLWVHAVSLGETRAAAVLIERWRRLQPAGRLLLTHGTATGWDAGTSLLRPGDLQRWLPWDSPAAVQSFFEVHRPVLGVLMETEVWPQLVAGARAAGVPLLLANARMSEPSMDKALSLRWLSRPAYGGLSQVWAQTEADAGRLQRLGAGAVEVLGNVKLDARPDSGQVEQGRRWRAAHGRPVVVFASSREGEEALWLDALLARGNSLLTSVQWLLVPRHPQRQNEVADLLERAGLRISRRSGWVDGPPASDTRPEGGPVVWLGDSLGEMALYYGMSHMALLGGSFASLGGQNLIEAAACGCPVVMGPHTFNFAQVAEQMAATGAAQRVPDMASALDTVQAWLVHGGELARVSAQASAFGAIGSGAAEAMAHRMVALADADS